MKSGLFSHPNKYLEDHSINTLIIAEKKFNRIKKPIENIIKNIQTKNDYALNLDKIEKAIKIICLLHDLGKSTNYFQQYLHGNKVEQKCKEHSFFSAYFAYFISKELINNPLLEFLIYFVIKNHHSNLSNPLDEEPTKIENKKELLKKQLESIDQSKFEILCLELQKYLDFRITKEKLKGYANIKIDHSFRIFFRKLVDENKKNSSFDIYFLLNLIFSILIESDKTEAIISDINLLEEVSSIYDFSKSIQDFSQVIDKHIEKIKKNDKINKMRYEAYRETIEKLMQVWGNGNRILCVNLPTGLGKTLINFSVALKIYDKIKFKKPKIIYCLPFLSIIDQSFNTISQIIDPQFVLKYHSLTELSKSFEEIKKKLEEKGNYTDLLNFDQEKFLIEDWESNIVITTFVQLFHTLVSNSNASIKKLNKLCNSIIILDEIQAIDPKYWKLIEKTINFLTETLDSYCIVSTATYPYIFEKVEFLSKPQLYIQNLDRFEVEIDLEPKTIENLLQIFEEQINNNNKTYLFIFNTIKSAKKFYQMIKNTDKTFLATSVIPKHRMQRINEIKQKKYRIVVSTQLIEAGVDIDFDVVVRDLAPLDSLNQSAGRCNRNFTKKGVFKIFKLVNEKNVKYSYYIYSSTLLSKTEEILKKYKIINEKKFYELLEQYYQELKVAQNKSEEFIQSISQLKYYSNDDNSISKFKLIDQEYPEIMIFIQVDKQAQEIWQKYQKALSLKNVFERKKEFEKMKSEFFEHVISLPYRIKNLPPFLNKENSSMGFISIDDLPHYYDIETGYITESDDFLIII